MEAGAFVNVQQSNGETALMKVNASRGAVPPLRCNMVLLGSPAAAVLGLVYDGDETVCGPTGHS